MARLMRVLYGLILALLVTFVCVDSYYRAEWQDIMTNGYNYNLRELGRNKQVTIAQSYATRAIQPFAAALEESQDSLKVVAATSANVSQENIHLRESVDRAKLIVSGIREKLAITEASLAEAVKMLRDQIDETNEVISDNERLTDQIRTLQWRVESLLRQIKALQVPAPLDTKGP